MFWARVMYGLDMLRVLGVCNMSFDVCYVPFHKMESYGCKTCSGITQFVLENMNGGQRADWEKKMAVGLL
jgi:hypothetical protein